MQFFSIIAWIVVWVSNPPSFQCTEELTSWVRYLRAFPHPRLYFGCWLLSPLFLSLHSFSRDYWRFFFFCKHEHISPSSPFNPFSSTITSRKKFSSGQTRLAFPRFLYSLIGWFYPIRIVLWLLIVLTVQVIWLLLLSNTHSHTQRERERERERENCGLDSVYRPSHYTAFLLCCFCSHSLIQGGFVSIFFMNSPLNFVVKFFFSIFWNIQFSV